MWWVRRYERMIPPATAVQKQGCFRKSEEDAVLDGDLSKVKTLFAPCWFQLSVQNVLQYDQARPEASAVHQHLLAPAERFLHLQSNNMKSRPAANRPWQILSFEILFGTAVVPSNGGMERGKTVVIIMYVECLHVLDDSDTSACHRRHQFYLVTALRPNSYDCSAEWTLLIVIYLSGGIMLSMEITEE